MSDHERAERGGNGCSVALFVNTIEQNRKRKCLTLGSKRSIVTLADSSILC